MTISGLLLLGIVLFISAFYQLKMAYWLFLLAAVLLTISWVTPLGWTVILLWSCYVVLVLALVLAQWRQRFLTALIMRVLQKRLPALKEAEKIAIQSGDAWWEKDLFSGEPNWSRLLSLPKPQLTQEEQSFLDNQVETLCALLNDWQVVHDDHNLTKKVWSYLQEEKFFGLVIPQEFGGLGFSALAHSSVVAKIATRSVSAAVNMMVPNSLGPGELLLRYGTAEQKTYYLPRLAKGEEIPCFALTGPDAGSDAGSIPDSGVVCYQEFQGKKTLGMRLQWDKRYITLAPIATVLGLAIHLYDPEHLLGEKTDIGITLCLIPREHPGVEIGQRHLPLYLAFMNGPTRGNNVFIPIEWIIGGRAAAGRGWQMLMECLSIGRAISLPALSTGCAQLIYRMTGAYARVRQQFNLPIGYFEGVKELLGEIAGLTYLMGAMRLLTVAAVDQHIKPAIASAIAKYHMTEMSRDIINKAMDIHAGHAIQTGPHNLLANLYMATPISITVEGANPLTRNLIIFGQGLALCHPYLFEELSLLAAPINAQVIAKFDQVFLKHVGWFLKNLARAICYKITRGYFIAVSLGNGVKNKQIKRYCQQLTRVSNLLVVWMDLALLLLGGDLKRRESLSARLGDIVSQLYMASAALKYFYDQGELPEELPYVHWCMQTCLYHARNALNNVADNFPRPWLGKMLRLLIPQGKIFSKANDQLCHQMVSSMLTPSSLRERLTNHLYLPKNNQEWLLQLEEVFKMAERAEPLLKKFASAKHHDKVPLWLSFAEQVAAAATGGVLTAVEAEWLLEYEIRRRQVMKVSEFSFDLHQPI